MRKPTTEERIKAYTETAGGCHACYAANPIPLTTDQVLEMLTKGTAKVVVVSEEGVRDNEQ